jgi:hypothetical protein
MEILAYLKKSNLYMDKPYVKIGWNPKDEILASYWKGFFSLEEIVATGNRLIQVAKIEQAQKVLYDTTAMEILDETSQRFIAGEFTRHLVEAGILYSAAIVPKDFMAKTAVENIMAISPESIHNRSKIFNNFNTALRWLRKKEVNPTGKEHK